MIYYVSKYSLDLIKQLLEATPSELNYNKILNNLTQLESVINIHDFHLWKIGN